MDRRHLIQIALAPGMLAQNYTPRFFTADEYRRVEALAQKLLPDEPDSPGARAANVPWYIDTVMLYSDAAAQAAWRSGLTVLTPEGMAEAASRELTPVSDADRFFGTFKRLALEAFLQSKAGAQALGYQGNSHRRDFPGCPPA